MQRTPQFIVTRPIRRAQDGFALVIALALMTFIMLLLVMTSTIVQLDMATLRSNQALAVARDNARLGLLVALGELQSQTGPDQRITANASLLNDVSTHPNWVGVWDSEAWNPDAPSAQPDTTALFRRWLVSLPDAEEFGQSLDIESMTLPEDAGSGSGWEPLVGEGTLGVGAAATDIVQAGKQTVPGKGHYAYWVGDENVKARFNLTETTSPYATAPAQAFALAAPQRWHMEQVGKDGASATDGDFDGLFDPLSGSLESVSSGSDVGLAATTEDKAGDLQAVYGSRYHDLSLHSMGLMANARDGGLKQDLSLAFEMDETDFNDSEDFAVGSAGWNSLYTDTNPDGQSVKSIWWLESDDTDEPNMHYKGPTWHLLRDYYNLYREVSDPTGTPTLSARQALPVPKKNTNNRSISRDYDNGQTVYNSNLPLIRPRSVKLAPVVARVQIVLSLTAVPVDSSTVVSPASYTNSSEPVYKLRLIADPIITLYNPYGVNLHFQAVTIEINNIVNSLRWELNDVESNLMALTEIFALSHQGYLDTTDPDNFVFGIVSIGNDDEGITMAPGEVKVYSAGNTSPVNYTEAVDAMEGWPTDGGFFVETLDPVPGLNGGEGKEYGHELNVGGNAVKGVILGKASDTLAVDFEEIFSGGTVKWISRNSNFKSSEKQMYINAYLVSPDAYDERHDVHSNRFMADRVPLYTMLRANVEFGDSAMMGNIGRVPESGSYPFSQFINNKQTLGQIDIRLKTEDNDSRPYPMFALSSMNAYATNVQSAFDDKYGKINPPFEVSRERVDDIFSAVQFDPDTNRGYWGPTRELQPGAKSFVAGFDVPKAPLVSLGQLQHVDTAIYGYESSHAIGNSFASPWIPIDEIEFTDKANIDTAFLANNALWDGYFFSSLTPQDTDIFGTSSDIEEVLTEFTTGGKLLPNARMAFLGDKDVTFADAVLDDGKIQPDAHRKSAGYLGVEGAFNVNSTSVEAWKTLYASMGEGSLVRFDEAGELVAGNTTGEIRISRFSFPLGEPGDKWAGYATLSDTDIQRLAEETVEQVRKRGPFLSMAQFVNRQIGSDRSVAQAGALQTAINDADINDDSQPIISAEYTDKYYPDYQSAMIPTDTGAAGFLTQADLLSQLGPFLTVRSDTFTIRAYGDAVDPLTGQVVARVWCEAVVQRQPDYIDSASDTAWTRPYDDSGGDNLASKVNQDFGRAYKIVQFRWLEEDEV